MGMRIPENTNALTTAKLAGKRLVNTDQTAPTYPPAKEKTAANVVARKDAPTFNRAGFGQGTVSPPAAAVTTLRKGVRSAKETVPTLGEFQDGLRADARQRAEQTKPAPQPRVTTARETVNKVENALNTAVGSPMAANTPARGTVQVGNNPPAGYLETQTNPLTRNLDLLA